MIKPKIKDIPIKSSAQRAQKQPSVSTSESFRLPKTERLHGIDITSEDIPVESLVALEAYKQGIDPKLIMGMVRIESSGNPNAKSEKGARGLMQVMPATARGMGFTGEEKDLHNPKISVSLGVGYFKQLLKKYNGDVSKALSAYNQGPGNLAKKGITNQDYIDKVKDQSFQGGGKVGVFDRPVSPQRIKPMYNNDLEMLIERALHKVMGHYAGGGQISFTPGSEAEKFAQQNKVKNVADWNRLMSTDAGKTFYGQQQAQQQQSVQNYNQNMPSGGGNASGTPGANTSGGVNFGDNSGGIMGGVQNTAQRLSGFNPLTGQAQQTTNELLRTGAPTDVSGITQAATQQGQDVYNNLIAPDVNEQFGAMGLGSSSARTQALGREAGRIGTNVGAEGLRAGVQAQESATGRRLEALNPYLGATGQQLSGLQSAGQVGLGAAGIASNERLSANQLGQNAQQFQAGLNQTAALANQQLGLQSALSGLGLSGGHTTTYSQSPYILGGTSSGVSTGISGHGFASGGRVDEGDFLSNLLYGRLFEKAQGIKEPKYDKVSGSRQVSRYSGGSSSYNPTYNTPNVKSSEAGPSPILQNALIHAQLKNLQGQADISRASGHAADIGVNSLRDILGAAYEHASRDPGFGGYDLAQTLRGFGLQGLPGVSTGSVGQAGFENVNRNPGAMIQNQRILDFYKNAGVQPPQQKANGGEIMPMSDWDMGGKVSGPAVPPDRVHVMAQGGEGVIPVKMMHELEGYQSSDPFVLELKRLMGMGHQPEDEMGMQTGGQVDAAEAERRAREKAGAIPVGGAATMAPASGGPVDILNALISLSALQRKKIKKVDVPDVGPMFSVPGQSKQYSPADFAKGFDPESVSFIKSLYPDLFPIEKKAKGGKVEKVMHEFKAGELHSGSKHGPKVTNRKQAIAIALSEQRKQARGGYAQGGQIPTGKSNVSKTPPLESLSYTNMKAGNPNTPSFSDADLAKYQGYGTNPGLDPQTIDSQIQSINLDRANEDRRRSLYEMLMATAGPGVRAKLMNLYQLSDSKIKESDARSQALQVLKSNAELARGQQEALNAYRSGQLNLGQGRLDVAQELADLKRRIAERDLTLFAPPDNKEEQ